MRWLIAVVVTGVVVTGVVVAGCGGLTAGSGSGEDGGWHAVAESPLRPREHAVAVSLGDRVLVVGGSASAPCPPNADCAPPEEPALRDGAIYDAAAGAWTSVADAPVPLGGHVVSEAMGDVAYFLVASSEPGGPSRLLSYDVAADEWDELPPPPVLGDLVAVDGELVVFVTSHEHYGADQVIPAEELPPDVVFDPATRTWAELPADPLRPSYDRKPVATDAGLVLLAKDLVPNPGTDPPIVRAAVLNAPGELAGGRWSRLPDGEILSTLGFSWTGGLLVNPDPSSADGGETNNWGRSYPGGGILDPSTGSWSDLPQPPAEAAAQPATDLPIELYLSGPTTAVHGQWALDVPGRQWFAVPQNAADGEDAPTDLPRTGYAAAWLDTPSGGAVLLWGGARWPGWDDADGDVSASGELTSDGFLWRMPAG